MAKIHEKQRVIALRKKGFSYKEIREAIPNISKSTLSLWCNAIKLTSDEEKLITKRTIELSGLARVRASETNRNKRIERDQAIIDNAKKLFSKYKNNVFFGFGLALYWAEGSKTSRKFEFTNSDPIMTRVMLRWMETYLGTNLETIKPRLYLHKAYEHENCEDFWAKQLNIPKDKFHRSVYKPNKYTFKKNQNYKGCIRIEISRVLPWLTVMTWQKLFVENQKI